MIEAVTSEKCETCNGYGYIFWGNDEDYDVESCECPAPSGIIGIAKHGKRY